MLPRVFMKHQEGTHSAGALRPLWHRAGVPRGAASVTPHARDGVGDEEEGHCPGALPSRPPGTWDRRLGHGGLELVLGGRGLPRASRSSQSWAELWAKQGGKLTLRETRCVGRGL